MPSLIERNSLWLTVIKTGRERQRQSSKWRHRVCHAFFGGTLENALLCHVATADCAVVDTRLTTSHGHSTLCSARSVLIHWCERDMGGGGGDGYVTKFQVNFQQRILKTPSNFSFFQTQFKGGSCPHRTPGEQTKPFINRHSLAACSL